MVGLPAFGQADGRPAGRVEDLLFAPRGERVIGLLLAGGRWWRRKLIPYEEVAAIGPAAVMLRRPVVLVATDAGVRRLRRTHAPMLGRRVLTPDGRDLGVVDDVCFDPHSGAVGGYLVSRGLLGDVATGPGFLPLEHVRRGGRGAALLVPPD